MFLSSRALWTRRSLSLVEILVVLGILCVLALPFAESMVSGHRKIEGLPKRLCALYYAHDLMEERLDKRLYTHVNSISRRSLIDFFWIRDNVARIEASEVGERRARIARSREFLRSFEAEVRVVEEVPGSRKRITVTVDWDESGHAVNVVLVSTLER